MFLTPNPFWNNVEDGIWYKNCPVGVNEISKWVKCLAENIGLDVKRRKISNHSLRSSAVSSLSKAGVRDQQLLKITGHQNINSIKPYLQFDEEHHQSIINQMREQTSSNSSLFFTASTSVKTNTESSTNILTSSEEAAHGFLEKCSNISFSNCSFNFSSK
jgi:hypothetical protein